MRPAGADLRHEPCDFLDRPGAGVDARPPQLGDQQMVTAEDIERQVAVAAIVAVEEPALLRAVQRVVSRIQVEHDLLGRRPVRVEEQLDEQPLDRRAVMADLVVARGLPRRRVLEPVEGRLAGKRRAIGATGAELASDRGQHRVVAQGVVVDQILVAQRQGEHPLADQGGHAVLDPARRTVIGKAGGKPPDQPDRPFGGAQQQRPDVGGDRATVERGHHRTPFHACKLHPVQATLCRHRGAPPLEPKALLQKNFRSIRAPMHLLPVRYPG